MDAKVTPLLDGRLRRGRITAYWFEVIRDPEAIIQANWFTVVPTLDKAPQIIYKIEYRISNTREKDRIVSHAATCQLF